MVQVHPEKHRNIWARYLATNHPQKCYRLEPRTQRMENTKTLKKFFSSAPACLSPRDIGGHLRPVTLKPVSRIFRVSCPHFPYFPRFCAVESPQTLFFWGQRDPLHCPHFPRIGLLLISKIRPTGFIRTGLGWPGDISHKRGLSKMAMKHATPCMTHLTARNGIFYSQLCWGFLTYNWNYLLTTLGYLTYNFSFLFAIEVVCFNGKCI